MYSKHLLTTFASPIQLRIECEIEAGMTGYDWEYIEKYATPRLRQEMIDRGVLFSSFPTIPGVSKLKRMVRLNNKEVYDAYRRKCRDIRWAIRNGYRRDLRREIMPILPPAPEGLAGTRVLDIEYASDYSKEGSVENKAESSVKERIVGRFLSHIHDMDTRDNVADHSNNGQTNSTDCSTIKKMSTNSLNDADGVLTGLQKTVGSRVIDIEFASDRQRCQDTKSMIGIKRQLAEPKQVNSSDCSTGDKGDNMNVLSYNMFETRDTTPFLAYDCQIARASLSKKINQAADQDFDVNADTDVGIDAMQDNDELLSSNAEDDMDEEASIDSRDEEYVLDSDEECSCDDSLSI
jgi:hypothetical protein